MPNPRRVQCGQPACRAQRQRERVRSFLAQKKTENGGVRYEDRYKVDRRCLDCARTFSSRHRRQVRCGPCGNAYGRSFGPAGRARQQFADALARQQARGQLVVAGPLRVAETLAFRLARERLALAAAGLRSYRAVWVGATCRRCGSKFVCMRTNDLPKFCSPRCLRATTKVRRRAAKRGGTSVAYRRIDIFNRDRWICQLCGKRTKRSAAVPDPKAPVIDHIVPLAAGPELGGVDAPWNVQCAHFLCNSIKSASFDQPALPLEVA